MTSLQRTVAIIQAQQAVKLAELDYAGARDTSSPDMAEKKAALRVARMALRMIEAM